MNKNFIYAVVICSLVSLLVMAQLGKKGKVRTSTSPSTDRTATLKKRLPTLGIDVGLSAGDSAIVRASSSTNSNPICNVSSINMPGADIGAKVNECDRRLGTNQGTINLSGGGEIRQQIVISSNHTLYVSGEGEYSATCRGPVILLDDHSSLQCESWKPVLLETTVPRTGGKRSDWYRVHIIVAAKKGKTEEDPNGAIAKDIKIRGCHFRGARTDFGSAAQAISISNTHDGEITNNWLENTHSIGIQAGGGSRFGYFARNIIISDNLLTGVASQNIAVTNADNVKILRNTIKSPSQPNGPGVSVIDVEPNKDDQVTNVEIAYNTIDASDNLHWHTTNGIVIQNGSRVTPFGNISVHDNTIIGAKHSERRNRISYAGLIVRHASGVTFRNNVLRRVTRCILVDYGSEDNTFEGNKLYDCGSGSTDPIMVMNSSRNRFTRNELLSQPGDAFRFPRSTYARIREYGTSDYNIFEKNDGIVSLVGPNSRVIP